MVTGFRPRDAFLTTMMYSIYSSTELAGLIKFVRPFLSIVSKAKAAKLVRSLVDMFLDMEAGTGREVRMVLLAEWHRHE